MFYLNYRRQIQQGFYVKTDNEKHLTSLHREERVSTSEHFLDIVHNITTASFLVMSDVACRFFTTDWAKSIAQRSKVKDKSSSKEFTTKRMKTWENGKK